MSQHVVIRKNQKFVFGWDPSLNTFFLQEHDLTKEENDEERVDYVAGSVGSILYEVDSLVALARKRGLDIPYETQVKLYGEKDEGI